MEIAFDSVDQNVVMKVLVNVPIDDDSAPAWTPIDLLVVLFTGIIVMCCGKVAQKHYSPEIIRRVRWIVNATTIAYRKMPRNYWPNGRIICIQAG